MHRRRPDGHLGKGNRLESFSVRIGRRQPDEYLGSRIFLEELQSKTPAVPWFVNAGTGRFSFGLFFWKMTQYGARGKVEWYYNLGKNERRSVVHFDGRNIHPTMDYERSREGIDDLKYLYKLQPLVNQAKKPTKPPSKRRRWPRF